MELKNRELKDRVKKKLRYIEELFYEPIMVSKHDIDKFQEQGMKKIWQGKRNQKQLEIN